ncbi:hypothetical protein GUJ93_ZPchr0109g40565 [Zizania palustris]|uniref:Uncharacterized protein n=1 Tax=Zizania palustris TaxID=103762 RepID=A0A8J5R2G9_ZIZPA|nr:hypothetical protein GUJ93_ZPchr0109g40565 [Zizania palustris]
MSPMLPHRPTVGGRCAAMPRPVLPPAQAAAPRSALPHARPRSGQRPRKPENKGRKAVRTCVQPSRKKKP